MRIHTISLALLIIALVSCTNTNSKTESKAHSSKVSGVKSGSAEEKATLIHVGDMAPDFTVQMLNGSSYTLSNLKGKVVLVNFWATWCPPCMQEFQAIPTEIVERFKGEEFILLPISRGETAEVVSKKMDTLSKQGINFPVGLDPDKSIYTQYATSYIPRNFLIDQSGKVVYTSVGYSKEEFAELTTLITQLLK
ncbi:TlpA family protein disulfide reductase [Saccharicrinis aurantiacus]|uniref:TlpA family protein disulfide reductase n=1 Tax=Saccharicrinis aurantiacus TaxID=1849719 RepID=UPI0008393F39|nr:TlpA disulfide reductase family protein [Saccharicrinis aurantiacus]